MQQRQQALREAARTAKLVVLPVRLSDKELSREGATHLAKLLSEQKLCQADVLDTPLYLEVPPSRNEQKMLWALARAFRDQVRQDPPEADYALYADYMFSPRDGRVRAVHYVVCDRDGEWVMVDFQNDHWEDFQSVAPKTMEDCNRLVAKRFAGYLR